MTPEQDQETGLRTRPLWQNRITLIGAVIGYGAIILLMSYILLQLFAPTRNPYVGLWIYMVLPVFLLAGLVLMPTGMLLERRRRKRLGRKAEVVGPLFDWSLARHRKVLAIVVVTTIFLIPLGATTVYQGYHFTDSNQFCARICHQVMAPQATAYSRSPHARVQCVECHIGPGATWYVKSKLSGARQVVAVLTDSYDRPIPPAITELRPARETCEHCHWPAKFLGDQLKRIAHFKSDLTNTPRSLEMIVKTGGGDPRYGPARGIHWHMALSNIIEYVATDTRLQNIIWVKQTKSDGTEVVYRSDGQPHDAPKPAGHGRTLDCMDCHNRPTHVFRPPSLAVDQALDAGRIDRSLPFIKREAVAALLQAGENPDAPAETIARDLTEFYEQHYSRVAAERASAIRQAIQNTQDIYDATFFPDMKVNWRTYPNNIGHKIFRGCFRCHNGDMVGADGTSIRRTCSVCHLFLERDAAEGESILIRAGQFVHPIALIGGHASMPCDKCHTGGAGPDPTCAGCHDTQTAFARGRLAGLERFNIEPDPMAGVDCVACHDLTRPTTLSAIGEQCEACHPGSGAQPNPYADQLIIAATELDAAQQATEAATKVLQAYVSKRVRGWGRARDWLGANQPVLRLLQQADPQHNAAAALRVFEVLAEEAREIAAQIDSAGVR